MAAVRTLDWIDRRFGALGLWLMARPARGFVWLAALHLVLWWLVLALSQLDLPLDVMEIFVWSQNPGWATHKQAPLTVWLFWLFDQAGFGWQPIAQLQAPLAWIVMAWAVWRLALQVTTPARALLSVLLLEAVGQLTFAAAMFNHNPVQLPFWALTGLCLWQGLRSGRLIFWLLTGLFAALGVLGKYFFIFLLAALFLFLLLEPTARRAWRTPGPYAALLVGAALLLPHLLSVAQDYHWQPFDYALDRARDARHWSDHLIQPLSWLLAQVTGTLGGLLALLLLWRRRAGPEVLPAVRLEPFARRFVLTLALGPLALCLLASAITGSRFVDLWGMPLWTFFGLVGVTLIPRAVCLPQLARSLALVVVLGGGALLLHLGWLLSPLVLKEPSRELFNGPALATAAEQRWQNDVGAAPPAYLLGSFWLAGNIAYYGPWHWRSDVFVNALLPNSPWVDLDRLRQKGALAVWRVGADGDASDQPPDWLLRLVRQQGLPPPLLSQPVSLPWRLWGDWPAPVVVRFAVIPPALP